jgi:hypothetical protein
MISTTSDGAELYITYHCCGQMGKIVLLGAQEQEEDIARQAMSSLAEMHKDLTRA